MSECATCVHWMADAPDRRKKSVPRGTCIAARCYTDFAVIAPTWCCECDPYSMNEATLRTQADFYCKHYQGKRPE